MVKLLKIQKQLISHQQKNEIKQKVHALMEDHYTTLPSWVNPTKFYKDYGKVITIDLLSIIATELQDGKLPVPWKGKITKQVIAFPLVSDHFDTFSSSGHNVDISNLSISLSESLTKKINNIAGNETDYHKIMAKLEKNFM